MSSTRQSEGHVLMPTIAIGSLALVLAAGFGFLGIIDRADHLVTALFKSGGLGAPTKSLPDAVIWLAAILGSFGLSLAILLVPGNWRRLILWASALLILIGWAPVLLLASRVPEISVPLLATFWSGLCAFVYASKHRMAVDIG